MASKKRGNKFYVVHIGRKKGIYYSWEECEKQVNGYPGARHRQFPTIEEAEYFLEFGKAINHNSFPHPSKTNLLSINSDIQPLLVSPSPPQAIHTPINNQSEPSFNIINEININTPNNSQDSANNPLDDYDNKMEELMWECADKLDAEKENEPIIIYTDGSCFKNGQSGANAGIGIYFLTPSIKGEKHHYSQVLTGTAPHTNNKAEILAVIKALELVDSLGYSNRKPIKILTDSQYVINSIQVWAPKWKLNNWKNSNGKAVQNRELLSTLDQIITKMSTTRKIELKYVAGHKGIEGNEIADALARIR